MKDLVEGLDKRKLKVTAIITKSLLKDHNELEYYDELIVTDDLNGRTEQFIQRSDFF